MKISGFALYLGICFFASDISDAASMEGQQINPSSNEVRRDGINLLNVEGESKELLWAKQQSERTIQELSRDSRYGVYRHAAQLSLGTLREIPGQRGDQDIAVLHLNWVYVFSHSQAHPHGLIQRATLDSYRSANPNWQIVLDAETLSRIEGRSLSVDLGMAWINTRCMILLREDSRRTSAEYRELDLETGKLVANGFRVPPARQSTMAWKDENTLLVATDFGIGTTTSEGFPLVVKEWRRGETLSQAKIIFRGSSDADAFVAVASWNNGEASTLPIVEMGRDNRSRISLLYRDGTIVTSALPPNSDVHVYGDKALLRVNSDWKSGGKIWKEGSLLSIPVSELASPSPNITVVFAPRGERERIGLIWVGRSAVLVVKSVNLKNQLWRLSTSEGGWRSVRIPIDEFGQLQFVVQSSEPVDSVFVRYEGFLKPPSLYEINMRTAGISQIRSADSQFDASQFVVEQLYASSTDGTRVPYFLVRARSFKPTGNTPTLLQGYGGFQMPLYPFYDGVMGKLWLEKGGVFVLASIRGGGEFGNSWHVRGAKRQLTYDDFKAVAQDLFKRGITSPDYLGIRGHSAGGLLVGVTITQSPELCRAAILEAPLLDQFRMDQTFSSQESLATELGSTKILEERVFLEQTSPYQNLRAQKSFPIPLILTSTTDDTVYPSQSRRFAAKMQSLGMPFFFYEFSDGGHAVAASPQDKAEMDAMEYTFLAKLLMQKTIS